MAKILIADDEQLIRKLMKETADNGAKIVVFPELCITGYTCSDMFLQDKLLVEAQKELIEIAKANPNANLYAYFVNTDSIIKHLHEIKKIQYVIDNVAFEDRVAKLELSNQLFFISNKLNEEINSLISSKESGKFIAVIFLHPSNAYSLIVFNPEGNVTSPDNEVRAKYNSCLFLLYKI